MSELGNVFDAIAPPSDAARGADLHVQVQVARAALGRSEGVLVDVPEAIEHDGMLVPRHREPGEQGSAVRLHLPATLPDRARLRLRGQGGANPEGVPGDLHVQVHIVDDPPRNHAPLLVAIAVALAIAVAAAVASG